MTCKPDNNQLDLLDFSKQKKDDVEEFIRYARSVIKIDSDNAKLEIDMEVRRCKKH